MKNSPFLSRPRDEALIAWAVAAVLLTVATIAGSGIPWVHSNLSFVAALVFLLVPGYFLRKNGEHESDYGLQFSDWKRGLVWGTAATVVTVLCFSPLFHLWETRVQERASNVSLQNYSQLGTDFYGAPHRPDDGNLHLWTWGQQTYVAWRPSEGPWSLQITPEAPGVLFESREGFGENTPSNLLALEGSTPRYLIHTLHFQGASAIRINAQQGAHTLTSADIRAGAAEKPVGKSNPHDTRIPLGYGWMLTMILTHVVLVAIPEEFFFRGYIQERLHQAWGRKSFAVLGLPLTWSIVVSSLLFALVHLISTFSVARLSVFFPSLVFGALRERTGGISASVVYHAACNLLVLFLSVHYF